MSINFNTNAQSVFAQNAMSRSTLGVQKSIEKLASGFRVNRAADDAAAVSSIEKLTAKIRGYGQAEQNIGDGISMLQTADTALSAVQENLQAIREHAVAAFNGTLDVQSANSLQRDMNERISTIADIAANTEYNGNFLLNDSLTTVNIQTGEEAGDTQTINFANLVINVSSTAAGELNENATVALDDIKISLNNAASLGAHASTGTGAAAQSATALADLDSMIDNVSRMRAEVGAHQNALESRLSYVGGMRENALASRARVRDVDVAKESSNLVKHQLVQQSAAAMISQANAAPQFALSLLP